MYLPVTYLTMIWALLPLASIAFPTSPSGLGRSVTHLNRLFGRGQPQQVRTELIPTSINPLDNTPIYAYSTSSNEPPTDIYGNSTSTVKNALSGPDQSIINFKWGFGPVIIDGRIDTDTLDTDITVWIYGLKLGEFHGNLVTGIAIDINLRFVKGEIKVYLKNQQEVWLHLELDFSFGKHLSKDVKILTLPDMPDLNAAPNLASKLPKVTATNAANQTVAA